MLVWTVLIVVNTNKASAIPQRSLLVTYQTMKRVMSSTMIRTRQLRPPLTTRTQRYGDLGIR